MIEASELLERPVEETARHLALALLERIEATRPRLDDPDDAEALHDFRVALRRLRSTLRAYRPYLVDSLSKPLERRLSRLTATTNPGRDAEVQLAWLAEERPRLKRHQRIGHAWLVARLAAQRDAAYREVREKVERDLGDLVAKLRRRLGRYRIEVELDSGFRPVPFREIFGPALAEHGRALAAALAAVDSLADEAQAHRARIAAKRLRYLLEPFAKALAAAPLLLERLRALQDLLGELNDTHVLANEIGLATAAAAAGRAQRLHDLALGGADSAGELRRELRRSERAGLVALSQHLAERRSRLFDELRAQWLAGRDQEFLAAVERLATTAGRAVTPEEEPPLRLGGRRRRAGRGAPPGP